MRLIRAFFVATAAILLLTPNLIAQTPSEPQMTIWRFDNVNSIGGHPTHVLGIRT